MGLLEEVAQFQVIAKHETHLHSFVSVSAFGVWKKKSDKQANQSPPTPPVQKPEPPKPTPQAPKVEPTKATLTPGMKAASKALDEGRYADAVRLYTAELAAEEARPAPSWMQLSRLNNELGLALDATGQYDKALEYFQKCGGHPKILLKKIGQYGIPIRELF